MFETLKQQPKKASAGPFYIQGSYSLTCQSHLTGEDRWNEDLSSLQAKGVPRSQTLYSETSKQAKSNKQHQTLTQNVLSKSSKTLLHRRRAPFGNVSGQTKVRVSSLGRNSAAMVECCGNINYREDAWLFIPCPHPQMSVG